MIPKIIIGLAAAFALLWTTRTKKKLPVIITIGMVVGIILVFFPYSTVRTIGLYIYMAFVAVSVFYGIIGSGLKIKDRIVVILISLSVLLYWLWVLNHWHGNTLLLPAFTILIAVIAVIKKAKLKNELGFIIILVADAVALLVEHLLKM